VRTLVETGQFIGRVHAQADHAVQHLAEDPGDDESVDSGCHNAYHLHPKLVHVPGQQTPCPDRRENAGGESAPGAADAMYSQDVKRVVVAQAPLEADRVEAQEPGDETNDQCPSGRNEPGAWGDRDQARHAP